MSKLANWIRPKIRCECYPCRERAEVGIGPIDRKGLLYQVCKDHAKQIRDDLTELLDGGPESEGVEYSVLYLEKDTGKVLAETKTGLGKIGDTVAEAPVEIEGYTPEIVASYPTLAEGPNIINFYYVAKKDGGSDSENADGGEPEAAKTDTALLNDKTVKDGQTPDDGAENAHKEPTDPQTTQIIDANAQAEPTKAVFTCKHCGEPFEKKTDLMSHAKVCPKKPPKPPKES